MAEYVSTHLVEITKMSFLPAQNQVHRTRCTEAIADTYISIHLLLELIFLTLKAHFIISFLNSQTLPKLIMVFFYHGGRFTQTPSRGLKIYVTTSEYRN